MNIIQQLKDNERVFGLMSTEMQAKITTFSREDIQSYSDTGWETCKIDMDGYDSMETWTFRLRPDYEGKTDTIEIKRIAIEAVMEILQKELDR